MAKCRECRIYSEDALASGHLVGLCVRCQPAHYDDVRNLNIACEMPRCPNVATMAPTPGNGGSDAYLCDECYAEGVRESLGS